MKKTTIAISGKENQGKSKTIYELRNLILSKYPSAKEKIYHDDGTEIKSIISIKKVNIGVESQGDPYSRQPESIKEFLKNNCDIIIASCRTRGDTHEVLNNTAKHGYRVIWSRNHRSDHIPFKTLNDMSAHFLLDLLDEILMGHL